MKKNVYANPMLSVINKIEKRISDGTYDYILTTRIPTDFGYDVQFDRDYSIINIVNCVNDIDFDKEGWNIWIVKNVEKECRRELGTSYAFLQIVNNEYGCDHHFLTREQINSLINFFLGDEYKINKIA